LVRLKGDGRVALEDVNEDDRAPGLRLQHGSLEALEGSCCDLDSITIRVLAHTYRMPDPARFWERRADMAWSGEGAAVGGHPSLCPCETVAETGSPVFDEGTLPSLNASRKALATSREVGLDCVEQPPGVDWSCVGVQEASKALGQLMGIASDEIHRVSQRHPMLRRNRNIPDRVSWRGVIKVEQSDGSTVSEHDVPDHLRVGELPRMDVAFAVFLVAAPDLRRRRGKWRVLTELAPALPHELRDITSGRQKGTTTEE
jgi:hypothetical protein